MTIDSITKTRSITLELADVRRRMADNMKNTSMNLNEVRDHFADFDHFFRPIRNYFYWEQHCYDISICWALRSIFDSLDSISQMSIDFGDIVPDLEQMAELRSWRH